MANLTSTVKVTLIDDVSKKAATVADSLKAAERRMEQVAKAFKGTGASDPFKRQLANLKLTAKEIDHVANEWKRYEAAQKHALGNNWAAQSARQMKAWERSTVQAVGSAKRSQLAYHKEIAASAKKGGFIQSGKAAIGHGLKHGMGLISAGTGGWLAFEGIRKAAEAAGERGHARVMSLNAGMTPDAVRLQERLALNAQKGASNLSVTELQELHKEIRSAVTHEREADEMLPFASKAMSVLKGSGMDANVTSLFKGAESLGLAQDPERLKTYINNAVKSMQVMGGTITPDEIRDAARYSKTGGMALSDRFVGTTFTSMVQEMGGSQAGNSLFMMMKHLRGGMQNKHVPVEMLQQAGLLADPSQIVRTKTGSIKGYKGKVVGDSLLATDPDKWVYQILQPALEKAGIKSLEDQSAWLQKAMPGTGANLVGKLLQQKEGIAAHAGLYERAAGVEGGAKNLEKDPKVAVARMSAAFDNLSAALMASDPAIGALNKLSEGVQAFANGVQKATDMFRGDAPVASLSQLKDKAWNAFNNSSLGDNLSQTNIGKSLGITGRVNVDHSEITAAQAEAQQLAQTVSQLGGYSAKLNIDSSSIQAAIALAQQLLGSLNAATHAGFAAQSAVAAAASSARAASASMAGLGSTARGSFSTSGVKGTN